MKLNRGQEAVLCDRCGCRGELRQHGVDFVLQRIHLCAGVVEPQCVDLRFDSGGQQRSKRLRSVVGQIALAAHKIVVLRARAGRKIGIFQTVIPGHCAVGQGEMAAKAVLAVVHVRVDVRPRAVESGDIPRAVLRLHDPAFQPCGAHQRFEGQRVARRVCAAHYEGRVGRVARAGIHIGDQPIVEPERPRIVSAQRLAVQGGNPLKHGVIQLGRLLRRQGVLPGGQIGLRIRICRRFLRGRFAAFLRRGFRRRLGGCFPGCFFGRFPGGLHGRLSGRFPGCAPGVFRIGRIPGDFHRGRLRCACLRRGLIRQYGHAAQQHHNAQKGGQYAQIHFFHFISYLRIVA